ncbi:hypothetical protein ST47_g260 [Ascochyta rabiei]|uniref:Ig-like domain-containing protein n=1 Tax=Didymella rabiei TaxID=5454 RepID=A0A163MD00_DIDRA|nr:hypothetical protein ST47_g260 [Ascochyta rabiei]
MQSATANAPHAHAAASLRQGYVSTNPRAHQVNIAAEAVQIRSGMARIALTCLLRLAGTQHPPTAVRWLFDAKQRSIARSGSRYTAFNGEFLLATATLDVSREPGHALTVQTS